MCVCHVSVLVTNYPFCILIRGVPFHTRQNNLDLLPVKKDVHHLKWTHRNCFTLICLISLISCEDKNKREIFILYMVYIVWRTLLCRAFIKKCYTCICLTILLYVWWRMLYVSVFWLSLLYAQHRLYNTVIAHGAVRENPCAT